MINNEKTQMNLKRIFIIWISIMAAIVGTYSFFVPSIPKVDTILDFKVTQNQTLYFKNIRAYFYEKEEVEKSGMDVYRFKKLMNESDVEVYPIIVHNWRFDEVYILFEERSSKKPLDSLVINGATDNYFLDKVSTEQHSNLALNLLPELYEEDKLLINNSEIPEKDKSFMRLVINDYLKWLK